MKKKVIYLIIAIFTLILVSLGIALWKINPIIAKIKPEVVKVISDAIGHNVEVGDIGVNFFPEISLEVKNVFLANETKSEKKTGIDALRFKSSLSELLKGKLNVKSIVIDSLYIEALKDSKGELLVGGLNLNQLAKKNQKVADAKNNSIEQEASNNQIKSLNLEVNEIKLNNSNIKFTDNSQKKPLSININDLNLDIRNISPSSRADLNLSASVLSQKKSNINIEGKINFLEILKNVYDFSIRADIKSISLKQIEELAKSFEIDLSKLNLNTNDVLNLSLQIDSKPNNEISINTKLNSNSDKEIFNKLTADINSNLTKKEFEIEKGKIEILEGQIDINANHKFKDQKTELKVSGENMNFKQVNELIFATSPVKINGEIANLSLNINKQGQSGLLGNFEAKILNGEILGFNILQKVVEKIKKVPAIGSIAVESMLSSALAEKSKDILERKATAFDTIDTNAKLSGGDIKLENLLLNHSAYKISALGVVSQKKINIDANFELDSKLTEKLIEKEEKLSLLKNSSGLMSIPVSIKKEGDESIKVLPDTKALLKNAAKNKVKDEAKNLLKNALPKKLKGSGSLLNSLF